MEPVATMHASQDNEDEASIVKRIVASVTERGQVTIPAAVRKLLGTKLRSKIIFEMDGAEVRIVPAPMSLEDAYASVRPMNRPEPFKEIERGAKDERAARLVRELHDQ